MSPKRNGVARVDFARCAVSLLAASRHPIDATPPGRGLRHPQKLDPHRSGLHEPGSGRNHQRGHAILQPPRFRLERDRDRLGSVSQCEIDVFHSRLRVIASRLLYFNFKPLCASGSNCRIRTTELRGMRLCAPEIRVAAHTRCVRYLYLSVATADRASPSEAAVRQPREGDRGRAARSGADHLARAARCQSD